MTNPAYLATLECSGANNLSCRCGSALVLYTPKRQFITCAACGAIVLTIKEQSLSTYFTQLQKVNVNLIRRHGKSTDSLTEKDSQ